MQVKMLSQPLPLADRQMQSASQADQSLSFGEVLNNSINKLNGVMQQAEEVQLKFVTGEVQDVHQVTAALQEARVSMQLAVEVRNKIVEAYQEISRLPL